MDTKFTKKNGRARLKVAVLNPDLIPDLVDVVIGDFVYELQFRVEKDMPDGESQVIDMDSTMDEDKALEEKEPENMDHDANKTTDDLAGKAPGKQTNASVAPSGQHKSKAVTGASTESMVMAAKLAGAAGVQQDLAATVGAVLQHSNLEVTESASVGEKSTYKPVVLLSPCGMIPDGSAQWKASLLQSKTLNGGAVSPVRASKRNVSTSDQDSLEKAMKLKARKNLNASSVKGNETLPHSFDILDDSMLLHTTSSLGISLGSNEQEVSLSLKSLRDIEFARMSANNSLEEKSKAMLDDTSTVCSLEENMDLEALNLICVEISEDLGDGGCDPLYLQTPISHSKKSSSKLNKKKIRHHSR